MLNFLKIHKQNWVHLQNTRGQPFVYRIMWTILEYFFSSVYFEAGSSEYQRMYVYMCAHVWLFCNTTMIFKD